MQMKYWIIIVALGIAWGSSFICNAILLREIGPLMVSAGRVVIGALGCWVYAIAAGKKISLTWPLAGGMLILGAFNFALPFAIYPLSQQYISSGVIGIVNATMPVAVVLVSHFWPGGEKITLSKSLGVMFGLLGIAILVAPEMQNPSAALWAILFALFAPLSYAVSVNYARRFADLDPTIVAALGLTGGAVFIAPLAVYVEGWPHITHMETWIALAIIGLVLTSVAFIVFYWLLPRVGAVNISTVTFIAPVSAVALGALILDETFLAQHILGMVAILFALIVIDGRMVKRIFQK